MALPHNESELLELLRDTFGGLAGYGRREEGKEVASGGGPAAAVIEDRAEGVGHGMGRRRRSEGLAHLLGRAAQGGGGGHGPSLGVGALRRRPRGHRGPGRRVRGQGSEGRAQGGAKRSDDARAGFTEDREEV